MTEFPSLHCMSELYPSPAPASTRYGICIAHSIVVQPPGPCVRMLPTPFLMWIAAIAAGYAHQNFRMILSPGSQEWGFFIS